jgi:hypothetical protein
MGIIKKGQALPLEMGRKIKGAGVAAERHRGRAAEENRARNESKF